ncbi:uncharacterized protein LY79DRAFT_508532 [Colletotrichum navitas]|uniref:Proteophosphoglycan ppg4 n=1 Tax=Colletotrichum navitas TaxID=681940 RepID=A0AAD8V914_9PEZI|nr:uncharacterized protein LY79DRAFT_508532 [Colletotrichum navitas]KAK1596853.1 hypothetical protein LY79DRAFT_508532 [Colletotrichum navitas]
MGNTHSIVSPHYEEDHVESNNRRSPHKLSKPRVGNHGRSGSSSLPPSRSNSQAFRAHSPAPSPVQALSESQASAPAAAEEPSPAAKPEPRPTKNWKRRASLFRSKSSQEPRTERRRHSVTTSPPLPDRMSRANSMTWETQQDMNTSRQLQVESWHIPGNRQSINYNLMSYESRRLLNLTEDLTACEEGSIMSESKFEVSPSTWKSSHPTQPAIPKLPRADSEVSLYAPVRRRSIIQTPGLATRLPTDYSASRRSSLRHSVATTPACGHSRLNSIESSTYPTLQRLTDSLTDFFSEPDYMPAPSTEPIERALTPSDMDYRPLGTMKFGSLRITNGAASPLPSPDLEPEAKAEVTEKLNDGKEEHFIRDVELGGSRSDDKDVEMSVSAVHASTALSPINTSFLRMGSRSQRPNSPLSPELQTTSKHTALEDELFEDDDVQLEYSAEVLTVRNDPNAKPSLERLRSEQSKRTSQAIVRTDSGVVASPTIEQPKLLSKADSGYSSNVSLRSFHAKQSAAKGGQRRCAASDDSGDEQSEGAVSPTAAVANKSPTAGPSNADDGLATGHTQPSSSTSPSPQPNGDFVIPPKSPTASSPKFFFNLNTGHSFRKDRKGPVTIDSAKPAKEGPTSPQSIPSGDASPDKPTSVLSIGTGSQRVGKFQRFMNGSSLRGPPAVHTTHPSDKPVPSVPQDVQVKLGQHSERFPTATTRLTLRPQASKDTLNTIMSVGSVFPGHADANQGPLLPADVSQVTKDPVAETPKPLQNPKSPMRRSFQSVPASIAHAAVSVLPRLPIIRKPLPRTPKAGKEFTGEANADEIQVGFESDNTAMGNVGDSDGNGAFYQAFLALPSQQPAHSSRERTMTLTAEMERGMRRSFYPAEPTSPTPQQPVLRAPRHSQVLDVTAKRRSSPPISLHTRNSKNTRKQAPRPKSAHSSQMTPLTRRPAFPQEVSHEIIHSYPSTSAAALDDALSAPPIPPMSPRRGMAMLEQRYAMRHMSVENKWRPTNGWSADCSQGVRPVTQESATSAGHQSQQQPPPQQLLRHRSSYDSYSQHRGPVARGPAAAPQGDGYYQQQLMEIQQQQWQQQRRNSSDAVQPGLSRGHIRSRSMHANGHPPFRVLHSYNSPAYRNVPIWG